jgi:hypothetical protein
VRVLLLLLCAVSAHGAPIDVDSVMQRSVAANRRDWSAAPDYSYSERDRDGNTSKTYDVRMILGSPYRRLVAVNDEPLAPREEQKQQRLMNAALQRRRAESPAKRAARIGKYQKERKRDRLLMDQLVEAFDFAFLGEEKLGAYDVYLMKATPRRGYHPPVFEAEVLTGMQGRLWIDKDSFQWVKVEAEVVRPVFIAGFLARVEPGTRFELEKAPVGNGVWLRSHFAMRSRAKVLFILTRRGKEDQTYFNYRKGD